MAVDRVRTGSFEVIGLQSVNKALKELGPEFKGEMRKTNKQVADFVAADAKSAAYSLGGVAAHVAPSIKSSAGAGFAGVSGGGSASPAFGGAEFGGRGRPTTQQFQPWRGNGAGAGYFVYPTIRRDADRIESEYGKGIDDLLQRAGLA